MKFMKNEMEKTSQANDDDNCGKKLKVNQPYWWCFFCQNSNITRSGIIGAKGKKKNKHAI
jgi:hypothetical protein